MGEETSLSVVVRGSSRALLEGEEVKNESESLSSRAGALLEGGEIESSEPRRRSLLRRAWEVIVSTDAIERYTMTATLHSGDQQKIPAINRLYRTLPCTRASQ